MVAFKKRWKTLKVRHAKEAVSMGLWLCDGIGRWLHFVWFRVAWWMTMWTSHQCGIVLLRNYSSLRYFVPGLYTNDGQAALDNGRFVKVEWTAFILLRKSVRPGKGNYVKEEKGSVLGCGSRRFHLFSPSYLGTFSGFCLWVVFVFVFVFWHLRYPDLLLILASTLWH